MRNYTFIFAFLLFGLRAFPQGTDWKKAAGWTLYSVHGRSIWQLSIDSLGTFNHVTLNSDSMAFFLAQTTILDVEKAPVWMGGYVASCTLDGKARKVLISSYGGFFYDSQEKRFYQLAPERLKDWLNYLTASEVKIPLN